MEALAAALDAREKGIVAIPCYPLTKVPMVRWKRWQAEMPPVELQHQWFRERANIAIITTGMVVFDVDDAAKAELVVTECGPSPHRLKTPRGGIHLGYRKRMGVVLNNKAKVKGLAIDIRTDGGIEVIPPSVTENGAYEWLGEGLHAISDLSLASIGWTRERRRIAKVLPGVDTCEPPFTQKECLHKLNDAVRLRNDPRALR